MFPRNIKYSRSKSATGISRFALNSPFRNTFTNDLSILLQGFYSQLCIKYLNITQCFYLNISSLPMVIYTTTAPGFWIPSLLISLKMWTSFSKIFCVDRAPSVSQMLPQFSRIDPAFIQISIRQTDEIYKHLKKM